MNRIFSIFTCLVALLVLCSCGQHKSDKVDNQSVISSQDTQSSSSENSDANDSAIFGKWQIKFYSNDNEEYIDYVRTVSPNGFFTFKDDDTAIIQKNEKSIKLCFYHTIKDKNTIVFSDMETGTNTHFYFGYTLVESKNGNTLVISEYNTTDKSIVYYMLSKVE